MNKIIKGYKKYLLLFFLIVFLIFFFGCNGITPADYTITATSGAGGSINPSGVVSISEGGSRTFTVIPDEGYQIHDILIDGVSVGALNVYTFTNVKQNHTIQASFTTGTSEFKVYNINTAVGYHTIQSAIDAASDGQTIIVYPGIFYENIYVNGKNITIQSSDPTNPDIVSATIIDGGKKKSVVWVTNSDKSTLEGFTIQNGETSWGGGIFMDNKSEPTIRNNIITGNAAVNGGAIYIHHCSPVIEDNIVTGNTAEMKSLIGKAEKLGGGIYALFSKSTIRNNTITGNAAGEGGGIHVYGSEPTISGNTITGNMAEYGGGVCANSDANIEYNAITNNTATTEGGGIYLKHSNPSIKNNTITGNTAYPWKGGGIYMYYSSPTIENNIIGDNEAGSGGGIYLTNYSKPTIRNNYMSGNTASLGGGIYATAFSFPTINNNTITGNIGTDGGGIYMDKIDKPTSIIISNNTISYNEAKYNGAGISMFESRFTLENNNIINNTSEENGGGIYLHFSNPLIKNNIIESNLADAGGGIYADWSSPTIRANTIKYNQAETKGGGVYVCPYSLPNIGGWDLYDFEHFNTLCGNIPGQIMPESYPYNYIDRYCK
jgi:parallel beta-helix repeat protein